MANKSVSKNLLFIPLILGSLFALLYVFQGWRDLEYGIYDLFLHMKPAIPQDKHIVMLDVDDQSIERYGNWPWPRSNMAIGLEVLTEFDARMAIFDIEYIEKSPDSADRQYLDNALRSKFDDSFHGIQGSINELFSAVSSRTIPLSGLKSYADDLSTMVGDVGAQLYKDTRSVAVENDTYLANAMRMYGRAFAGFNLEPEKNATVPQTLREVVERRFPYTNITKSKDIIDTYADYTMPIEVISSQAAGAGFTTVPIDPDGKRRRIHLVNYVDGKAYLQLLFGPFMILAGNPAMEYTPGHLRVKGAHMPFTPEGTVKNFDIPLDPEGRMLINWPKATFEDSFKPHYPFINLLDYKETESELARVLSSLDLNETWKLLPGSNPVSPVLASWNEAEDTRKAALKSGTVEDRQAYVDAKNIFYENLATLSATNLDKTALDRLIEVKAKDIKANAQLYDELAKKFSDSFVALRKLNDKLVDARVKLRERLKDASCFIGWTGHATTDLGANPFSKQYANVGTHAAILNTLLQGRFLSEAPYWLSALLSLGLAFGLIFAIRNFGTGMKIAVGLGAIVVLFFAAFAIFAITGVFISLLSPLLAVFTSFLSFTLAVFFLSEQEKTFLRKAFSTYLSADVIAQIVNDPTMLKLGGQKMWLSAMFTDVQGFSTISEQLEPENLVSLLNHYLSGMSDIILANRGTIDKFEGDAIISFFGAPVPYETHAKAICASAIAMKRKEIELNALFMEQKLTPRPLLTRIGLNTGDMVVGNMGTEKKMDYTIMGNAVNLAARLEGVNKQYDSWILAASSTREEAGDEFAWRQLSQVRVVGINKPVRLYELIDYKSDLSPAKVDLLERFGEAITMFETGDYKKSAKLFSALIKDFPEDEPSKNYYKRSIKFQETPPAATWDGIFNLTDK